MICRETVEQAHAICACLTQGCFVNLIDFVQVPTGDSLAQVGSIDSSPDLKYNRSLWAQQVVKRINELQALAQRLAERAEQEIREVQMEQEGQKKRIEEVMEMLKLANECIRNVGSSQGEDVLVL